MDEKPAQRSYRRISRLDVGCVRFLPHGIHVQGYLRGTALEHAGGHDGGLLDLGDAAGRRISFWPTRGSIRPQARAHVEYFGLFASGNGLGICSEHDDSTHRPGAFRCRHGRGMGHRLGSHDGIDSRFGARRRVGIVADRLPVRLLARIRHLWPVLRSPRLAIHVHARRDSGNSRFLYQARNRRIARMEGAANRSGRGCTRSPPA